MFDWLGSGVLTIIAFLLVMGFVVVIHELGHYWAGRLCGVHAEAFSLGFGPTVFARPDRHGTVWKLSALPLGGFVQFRGDANAASAPDYETLAALREQHPEPETVLHFKPVWQRAFIVAAGPLANFALAIVLFAVLGALRGELRIEPRIGTVAEASAAQEAGFEVGDVVLRMDGVRVDGFTDIRQYVLTRAGQLIEFDVQRGPDQLTLSVTPDRSMRPDGLGGERAVGFVGLGAAADAEVSVHRPPVWAAPVYGVTQTWETSGMILDYMARLVTGRASTEHINGPVGIATTAGQLANQAVAAPEGRTITLVQQAERLVLVLLGLSALLSVALGLMNLLPIPVLDGGHLVYYAYEAVAQRPPSPGVQELGFRLGIGLILAMLAVATWNDLSYLRGQFL